MSIQNITRVTLGLLSVFIFAYPIVKMTSIAMDNNVNLYPVLMVILAGIMAFMISKVKKK